jgi:tripartite-type tricarboxylate transporter receptor subunit TctC
VKTGHRPLRALPGAAAPRDLGVTDLREQNMISVRTLSVSFASVALLIATVAASAETWPKALQLPAVREKLATLGVEEQPLSVEQFDKFVSDDMAATLVLAKSAHLEPED